MFFFLQRNYFFTFGWNFLIGFFIFSFLLIFGTFAINDIFSGATPKDWTIVVDGCYLAPYAYNGPYWVGYDDVDSIRIKSQWINSMELGGSMVWSIEADDWRGDYGVRYPLVSEIKRVMNTGESLDPGLMLGPDDQCETAPSCWSSYQR